jgi:hypothetical protein
VRGQVEREVEGRDERAGPDRHPLPHARVVASARRDVERQHLADDAHRLFCGDAEGIDEAPHLAFAVFDGLAGFDAQALGELVGALREALHTVHEHGLALVGLELTHRLGGFHGGGDGLVDGGFVGEGHVRGDLARILVDHRQIAVRRHGAVGQIIRIVFLEHPTVLSTSAAAPRARSAA